MLGIYRDTIMAGPDFFTTPVAETVDSTGLKCPEPIMMIRNALRKVEPGTCLRLLATDPSTLRDIPIMCRFMDHNLISQELRADVYEFVIARGSS